MTTLVTHGGIVHHVAARLLAASHQLVEPTHRDALLTLVATAELSLKTPNPASPRAYRIWHAPAYEEPQRASRRLLGEVRKVRLFFASPGAGSLGCEALR